MQQKPGESQPSGQDRARNLQARRAEHLRQLHQSQEESARRLNAPLYREPFSILKGGDHGRK